MGPPAMSIQARVWARGRVPRHLAAVLFVVCDYADRYGVAWVGQAQLALDCSCSKRTVSRDLAAFEADGLIRRVKTRGPDGRQGRDFVILAPLAADRGPLLNAPAGRYPAAVVELAQAAGEGRQGDKPGTSRVTNGARQGDKQGTSRVTPVSGWDSAETPVPIENPGFSDDGKIGPNVVQPVKATPPPPAVARDIAREQPEPAEAPVVGEEQNKNQGNSNVNVNDATVDDGDHRTLSPAPADSGPSHRPAPRKIDFRAALGLPPKEDEP